MSLAPLVLVLLTLAPDASPGAAASASTCRFSITPRTDKTPIGDIQLLSPTLVLGSNGECLYVSENGGQAFQKVRCAPFAPQAEGHIRRFFFLARTVGWAITEGALIHTRNGGVTWELRSSPEYLVRDVRFSGPLTGFWVGERVSGGVPDVIPVAFMTKDGGQTWSEVALPSTGRDRARLEGVWMKSPSEVWVVGDLMLVSQNAGQTWRKMNLREDVVRDLRNTAIRFGHRGVGWILRVPSKNHLRICDGGKSWAVRPPPVPGFDSLLYTDCTHAYASAGGILFRSTNGGRSFRRVLEPEEGTQGYTALAYWEDKRLLMAISENAVATCQTGAP
ncbi:MAG TPA: YCF48-related protein [Myxococcus sp.]|nr:YCF48-related protein [Myxococcus sp.]